VKRYHIKEVFYSLQGEGLRSGCPSVFVRFGYCNLACNRDEHGFDCDTDFTTGLTAMTADEILGEVRRVGGQCRWIVFTGGEPTMQLDDFLVEIFRQAGYQLAIETNGTRPLPVGIDHVCVSPKTSPETIRVHSAQELKLVLANGQTPRAYDIDAQATILSPAWDNESMIEGALPWCVCLCLSNPEWRLSVQQHKSWGVR
jgi:7-carboxy-7-deazaguanine synthase